MEKIVKILAGFAVLALFTGTAHAALEFPDYIGHVNDFAEIISPETESLLEQKLINYEAETGHEIAVATVDSLQETTTEDYAVRLFENWGLGKTNYDNGVLLLVAPNEREVRIEVGYGLGPILTDAASNRIISDIMAPAFKVEDFDGGVTESVEAIMGVCQGEIVYNEDFEEGMWIGLISVGVIFVPFLIYMFLLLPAQALRKMKTLKIKALLRGSIGIVFALLGLFGSVTIALIVFGFIAGLGFLIDIFAHKYRNTPVDKLPWWLKESKGGGKGGRGMWFGGGSGGSGSGSGGGGFGGFGGGMSGGGGASGRW